APSAAADRADDEQKQHRAPDRDQPGPQVEEVAELADVKPGGDEAADQGPEDADRHRAEAPARLAAPRHERPGDEAREQAEEDPGDDAHAGEPMAMWLRRRPRAGPGPRRPLPRRSPGPRSPRPG